MLSAALFVHEDHLDDWAAPRRLKTGLKTDIALKTGTGLKTGLKSGSGSPARLGLLDLTRLWISSVFWSRA